MRLTRRFVGARRLPVVSVMVLASAIGLATGCSSVRRACAVVFTDGTSYTTPATITDPSTDPDIATESFSFNNPPPIDITTAPLPSPAVALPATSPDSLLLAGNLAPVLGKLTARFGRQDLIVQRQHPVPCARARQRPAGHHAERHTQPELNIDRAV